MVLMVSRRRLEDGDFDAWKKRFEATTTKNNGKASKAA